MIWEIRLLIDGEGVYGGLPMGKFEDNITLVRVRCQIAGAIEKDTESYLDL